MDKGEVFAKADLSDMPKTKAKLKKRELAKARSKPSAKRQKDNASLKAKHQLVNQENRLMLAAPVIGLGRSKNQSASMTNGRLGRTLHGPKAKVSETVTTRKVLGSMQPNIPAKNQFHYDLQRVLGKDQSPSSPPPHEPTPASESESRLIRAIPASGTFTEAPPPPVAPSTTCPPLPLVEISQRLVQGLQVDVIFPHSTYLENIKAELKKVLKQSNPYGYDELVDYFTASNSTMTTPIISQLQQAMLPGAGASGADMVPTCEPQVLSHTNPAGSSGVSDIVALNLEVNTSALNINDQITPEDTPGPGFPSDAPHSPGEFPQEDTPRPRDFLDLVDSVTTDWNATPTRPRMFPHKLF